MNGLERVHKVLLWPVQGQKKGLFQSTTAAQGKCLVWPIHPDLHLVLSYTSCVLVVQCALDATRVRSDSGKSTLILKTFRRNAGFHFNGIFNSNTFNGSNASGTRRQKRGLKMFQIFRPFCQYRWIETLYINNPHIKPVSWKILEKKIQVYSIAGCTKHGPQCTDKCTSLKSQPGR